MLTKMNLKKFIESLKNTQENTLTNAEKASNPSRETRMTSSSSKNLEDQFFSNYTQNTISLKLPNLTNTLRNTKISNYIRSSMIDWKIEIYINVLKKYFGIEIIFKSIQIMDMYLKKQKNKILENEDIHLIGITALYLSCKLTSKKSEIFKELIPFISYNKFSLTDLEKLNSKEESDKGIVLEADNTVDIGYVVKVMEIASNNNFKIVLATSQEE